MKKLFIYTLTVFAFLVFFATNAFAFFTDVQDTHWAYKQIRDLSEQSIVIGYPDGSFKPDDNVTRAEFASMAIKALGQEHSNVVQQINFTDIDETYWAYDAIKKAVYFDLISNDKSSDCFRPEDSVSRAEAINIAVNSLTTEQISKQKAHDVLSKKYKDVDSIPEWFLVAAGKAEILEMIASIPERISYIDSERPATRAEVTAILNNMMVQAKLNPNAKLAEAMRKKTGDGYVVQNSFVQGTVGTIPEGSIVPVVIKKGFSSQKSIKGEEFYAISDCNYITKDKYILMYKNTNFKGVLKEVQSGRLFRRNGKVVLMTNIINTPNDQNFVTETVCDIVVKKNKFMTWFRKWFKGEKIIVKPNTKIYIQFQNEIKTDLTNGWIYYK